MSEKNLQVEVTKFVIYKISFGNDKVYIGSTSRFTKRKYEHLTKLRTSNHKNPHLQNAFNIYGEGKMFFEIIENPTEAEVLIREQYWIDLTLSANREYGYNICKTAGKTKGVPPPNKGKKMSEEQRVKLQATWAKNGEHWKGKKMAKEVVQKRCDARTLNKTWGHTTEDRKSMSKPILQIDINGNVIKEFYGASEAAEILEIQANSINRVAFGSRKSCKGYFFKYK